MFRRHCRVVFLLLVLAPALAAQEPQSQSVLLFQPEQRAWWENFLRTARVVKIKGISTGIASPKRVTLTDGTITHDSAFKSIDYFRRGITQLPSGPEVNLKDSYKFEIAAYELDKILQINMIPPTVARSLNGEEGEIQVWIDDAQMELDRQRNKTSPPDPRAWNAQMHTVRLFDGLIYNFDRNLGNLLITKDWKLWMIDHSRSFKTLDVIFNAKDIIQIPRALWERIQALDYDTLNARLKPYLTDSEIRAILKRRDALAKHIEKLRAQKGEGAFY